ncbi:anti-CRISPR protein AcrIIA3 [Enterococcus dongliensis]|uniref:anti-CRISPR protein AcrIIA3 n=1 Tax=Enterococcus dongliensis TaxID=2559925 RepID=UPI0028910619|nr:anti-CRISPR protein AcrIIA3 [Enterococcus dongliensis]MDT2639950.1 anti-CRISPR protein AcrIIA3 [Enterococcus dongliensis]
MFNKSEIMTQAWIWFNNDEVDVCDINWTSYGDTEKTFGVCLKAAWAKAKEDIEERKVYTKSIASSEELKAWNWAEKKLNFVSGLTDESKYQQMMNIDKETFGMSVWQKAIKAAGMFKRTAA